jgi:hypothetical protein
MRDLHERVWLLRETEDHSLQSPVPQRVFDSLDEGFQYVSFLQVQIQLIVLENL